MNTTGHTARYVLQTSTGAAQPTQAWLFAVLFEAIRRWQAPLWQSCNSAPERLSLKFRRQNPYCSPGMQNVAKWPPVTELSNLISAILTTANAGGVLFQSLKLSLSSTSASSLCAGSKALNTLRSWSGKPKCAVKQNLVQEGKAIRLGRMYPADSKGMYPLIQKASDPVYINIWGPLHLSTVVWVVWALRTWETLYPEGHKVTFEVT